MSSIDKRKVFLFLISLYLFFYIFLPPIIGINLRVFLTLVNILLIVCILLFRGKILISSAVLKSLFGFFVFYIFFLINQLMHCISNCKMQSEIVDATISMTLSLVHVVIACFLLSLLCQFYNLSFDEYISCITKAGMIELCLVIMAFISPSIRNVFNGLMIKNAKSDLVVEGLVKYSYQRNYGLANNLFDSFGYITSLIIALTFLMGIEKKEKKLVLLSLFMIVMPLLNSRSGLLLSFVAIIIVAMAYFRPQIMIRYIVVFFAGIGSFLFVFRHLPENIREWVGRGFTQTFTLITGGGTEGVYKEILSADMQFPPDILFGKGFAPEIIDIIGIDSGYVQCIWRFGLVGTILLLLAIVFYFFYYYVVLDIKVSKVSLVIVGSVFLIYLFKLYGLGNSGANIIVFGVPIVASISNNTMSKNDEKITDGIVYSS